MSIYGAMFSGVSGLFAQSQAMGMISDNISNVNTIGYKETRARFSTLVTRSATPTNYAPGGVRSTPQHLIDRQGLLTASDSATDIAVSGNGFFVVNEAATPGVGNDYMYTRAGSFSTDEAGYLRNSAGFYLQGWRLNADGSLAAGVNPNVLSGMESVGVSNLIGTVESTTSISLGANLPADATVINPAVTANVTMSGNLNQSDTPISQTVQVYDAAGAPYTVDLTYTNTTPGDPSVWDVSVTGIQDSTGASVYSGTASQGSVTYTGGSTTDTVTMNLVPLGVAGVAPTLDFAATADSSNATTIASTSDGSPSLAHSSVSDTYPMTVQVFDTLGVAYNVTLRMVKSAATSVNSTWDTYVQDITRVSDGTRLSGAPSDPDDPSTWGASFGSITFDSNGRIASTSVDPVPAPGAPLTLSLDMSGYDPGNGAAWSDGTNVFTVEVGNQGSVNGLTQYSTDYIVDRVEQDGVQFGAFAGVTIDEAGIVTALFDNGRSLKIYQIPLANFSNANGLSAKTGNAFLETDRSGPYSLREANTGGAGIIQSGALEASTVDLANEFTNMIITQRAYSASAKIITTADEMLEELVLIKR